MQYEGVMLEAFELEDVIKCRQLRDYTPRTPVVVMGANIGDLPAEAGGTVAALQPPRFWSKPLWVYTCVVRPISNKVRTSC
jgi:hypothetical protein